MNFVPTGARGIPEFPTGSDTSADGPGKRDRTAKDGGQACGAVKGDTATGMT